MKYTDIKIGYNCNNNCVHCVIADQREYCKKLRRPDNRSTQEYISEMMDSRSRGFDFIVFTGGEPTIRKDILFLLAYAKKLGFEISMQTNGRAFSYKEYARKFVPFNISYAIALHGHTPEIHESITRVRGSFNQTVTGIKNLIELGSTNVVGKTVISSFNYRFLPQIADTFLEFGVKGMNFAFPHANGNAWKYFDAVVPTYTSIMPYIYETIHRVQTYNAKNKTRKGINFEAIPFCLMNGYEKYVSELNFLDNTERELKQLDSGKQDWNIVRKKIKSKFPQCAMCTYDSICEGVWKEYPEKRGSNEFTPITHEKPVKNHSDIISLKKKLNITLLWSLYTPYPSKQKIRPNLSIAYLSKYLEEYGFENKCIDCNLFVYDKWGYVNINSKNKATIMHKLIEETEKTSPDILALGCWTEGISFVKEFAQIIKERNSKIIIILGGPLATFLPQEIFDFIPEIDYIVRGEGEKTLLELIKTISAEEKVDTIAGISYRIKNRKTFNNPDRPLIRDLDTLPIIDFSNFVYTGKHDCLDIITSRGCPYNCHYCASGNLYQEYRCNSPKHVAKQVKHLIDLYNVETVSLADDNVFGDKIRAKKLFGTLAHEMFDCQLSTSARVDILDKNMLDLLFKAKVNWLTVGLENIVPNVLSYYQRTDNPKEYIKRAHTIGPLLKEFNIGAAFTFIFGAPYESEVDMLKNLAFVKQLSKQEFWIYASQLRIVPGSHCWNDSIQKKNKMNIIGHKTTNFPFDEPYKDKVWVCPSLFAVQSHYYSHQKYLEILNNILLKVNDLKNY